MSYTVEAINSKEVNTKFGMKPTYSIKCGGVWYKCGFKNPKVGEGAVVEFSYTEGAYGKDIDMATFRSVAATPSSAVIPTPTTTAPKAAPTPTYSSKGVFPIPPLDGQRAIVRQNSLTNAVNLVKECLDPKKPLPLETLADECIKIARMFEAYSCGDLDLEAAKAMVAAKSVPKNAEDDVSFA